MKHLIKHYGKNSRKLKKTLKQKKQLMLMHKKLLKMLKMQVKKERN